MTVLDYRGVSDATAKGAPGHWLLWAIYLAMSWTWCIGMFLPVLLVRDYGGWGWILFAIPNVLGAAAVGWLYRSMDRDRVTAAHAPAMTAFSIVTAGFQIFLACWVIDKLPPDGYDFHKAAALI